MILDKSTRSLKLLLGEAKTSQEVVCVLRVRDFIQERQHAITFPGTSNGVTAVTVCPAPLDNTERRVEEVIIYNADTVDHTIIFEYIDGATTYVLVKQLLPKQSSLIYTTAEGWKIGSVGGNFAPIDSPVFTTKVTLPDGSVIPATGGWTVPTGSISINATSLLSLLATDGNFLKRVSGALAARTPSQVNADLDAIRCRFQATLTANANNITGDGTATGNFGAWTASENIGSAFNVTTGVFTAPSNGTLYGLGAIVFGGLLSTHTQGYAYQVRSDGEGFLGTLTNVGASRDSSGNNSINLAHAIPLTSGQTVNLTMTVNNGTKVVAVYGGSGQTKWGGLFVGK